MRIIKEKTLIEYCGLSKYSPAESSIKAWIYEVKYSFWNNANDLKAKYRYASIISSKRVVFNIKGNIYRLIADIEYKLGIVLSYGSALMKSMIKLTLRRYGMKIKILKTEEQYKKACERVYHLMHSTEKDIMADSPEGEELELLSLLIEKYEEAHYPVKAPDPIEAIKFRMEQMNLKQNHIAPLFGGKTRASEVLNGKRLLNLKMITLLNRYLGIPLESLISENKDFTLETEKKEKFLSISSIKEYLDYRSVMR